MTYASNTTYADVAQRISAAKSIALVTHRKPDGDAIGSCLAMSRALHEHGKSADILLMGPFEPSLAEIARPTPWINVDETAPADDYDLIVVLDTGSWAQLEPLEPWLRRHHDKVIGLDHHAGGTTEVAAHRIVEVSAASATIIVLKVLDEMKLPITGEPGGVGEALFVGLATDSGWFRYSNAGAEAFDVASRLIALGVERSRLFQVIEETHRPARLDLMARALQSIQYSGGGAVAIMSLAEADFRESGGSLEDLTSVVNLPFAVGAIQVSVLLTQVEAGLTKMSFRSKPATSGTVNDVNELAGRFGGGGHVHAAGARFKGNIEDAAAAVVEATGTLIV